jgi:hypothetical protein
MLNEPVIPVAFDVFGVTIIVLWAVLVLTALITVSRSRSVSANQRLGWMLAILILPVIGSLVWLATLAIEGSRLRRARS